MCEPAIITSIALTAVSTAVGMAGQAAQTDQANSAAAAQAEYQQSQLDQQKALAEQQAQDSIARGIEEKNQLYRDLSRGMGEQRSMLAASGFEMDSGSALEQLTQQAAEGQHKANLITQNAGREAYNYQVGAVNAANEKSLVASTAKNTIAKNTSAAAWGMGTSLLGGMGTALNQYKEWKKKQT